MRSTVRAAAGVLALTAAFTLAACGGSDDAGKPSAPASSATASFSAKPLTPTKPSPGPRPTAEQLTAAIKASKNPATHKKYTDTQASCIADVLLGTDLSDGTLNALAANIGTYVPGGSETKTFQKVIPKILDCTK